MREAKIIVDMIQGELLSQAVLPLAQRADLKCPRTFSTDLDTLICESQGGEKGKVDANGGRHSSFPLMPWTGIIDFLTISINISITYVLTFVRCVPLWPS